MLTGRLEADFSAFVSACAKAEVSLRGLDSGAGRVSTSLSKMVNSFSGGKIIQDATLMAEAVSRLGGAATLTAAEQAKVNRTVTEAIEKYAALGQQAPKALTDLAAATTKVQTPTSLLSKTFGDLGTQIKVTALGFISAQAIIGAVTTGFRLLTDFVGSSVASFAAAEAASRKLEAALKAQGDATPGLAKQYDALANNFQKTTVFADDLITEMQALLVQVGDVGPQQMERALTAATDLASGLGIDLRTATLLVGKAFEGETGTLKKYGIVVDEAKLKTQGITAVLDAVQEKFGGQAQAEIDTYAGKVKQLANAWDDVKESVGGFIVQQPALQVALSQVLDLLRGNTSATGELTEATDRQAKSWFGADLGVFGFANGLRDGLRIVNDMAIGVDALRLELEMLSKVKPPATFGVGAPILLEGISLMTRLRQEAEHLVQRGLKPLNKEQTELIRLFDKGGTSAGEIATKLGVSERAVKRYLDAVKDGAKAHEQLNAAMDKAAAAGVKAFNEWQDAINKLNFDMGLLVRGRLNDIGEAAKKQLGAATDSTVAWIKVLRDGIPVLADLGLKVNDFGKQIDIVIPKMAALSTFDKIGQGLAEALGNVPKLLQQAFTGGGGLLGALKAFGVQMAEAITAPILLGLSKIQKAAVSAGSAAATAFGGVTAGGLGATVASIASGLGGAALAASAWGTSMTAAGVAGTVALGAATLGIGAAAVGVAVLIKRLTDNKGRDAIKKFAEDNGGFDALQKRMAALGAEGEQMWIALTQGVGRNNPQQAQAVIAAVAKRMQELEQVQAQFNIHLQGTLQEIQAWGGAIPAAVQPYLEALRESGRLTSENIGLLAQLSGDGQVDWQKMQAVAEKYGIAIGSLGQTFQDQRLHAGWQEIIDDADLLLRGGADINGVLAGMGDEISKLVNDSIKFGTEIPENMRPWLEKLIAAGQLLDESGNKITNIGQLKFGATLQSSLEKLKDTIQLLIDTLNKVPGAINAIPRNVDVDVNYRERRFPDAELPDVPAAASAAASASALLPAVLAQQAAMGRVLQFPQPLPQLAPTLASEVSPSVAAGIAAGAAPTTIILEMDSRQVAEATVPHIPGVVQRYGLA